MTRGDVADFLAALILVYTICIVGWVVLSLIFSLGVRMPYNRVLNGVMDFLRDVSNPFLALFRKLPLQVGPLDLSPMVAIIVLQIGGGIIVGLVRGSGPVRGVRHVVSSRRGRVVRCLVGPRGPRTVLTGNDDGGHLVLNL